MYPADETTLSALVAEQRAIRKTLDRIEQTLAGVKTPACAPERLTLADLAETLGVSDNSARRLCREGDFPWKFRVGKKWLIDAQAFKAWWQEQCLAPKPPCAPSVADYLPPPEGRLPIGSGYAKLLGLGPVTTHPATREQKAKVAKKLNRILASAPAVRCPTATRGFLTSEQVATLMGISLSRVWGLLRHGGFAWATRDHRGYIIDAAGFQVWWDDQQRAREGKGA